jgi:hypothetical protein
MMMRCLGWSEWGSTLTMMILNRVSGEQNFTLTPSRVRVMARARFAP